MTNIETRIRRLETLQPEQGPRVYWIPGGPFGWRFAVLPAAAALPPGATREAPAPLTPEEWSRRAIEYARRGE